MRKLYKVTSTTTTLFVADVDLRHGHAVLRECADNAISRELENNLPRMDIEEVKSLDDLPDGWHGNELVWGTDEDITAKKWFSRPIEQLKKERSIEELELEIESLKREIESFKGSNV